MAGTREAVRRRKKLEPLRKAAKSEGQDLYDRPTAIEKSAADW